MQKADLTVLGSPLPAPHRFTRREVVQGVLTGIGIALTGRFADAHPIHQYLANPAAFKGADETLAAADWKPDFLNTDQNESLIVTAERMIPGSTQALVNRVIDLLLTVDTQENQHKFINSLAALDAESRQRFGRPVSALGEGQIDELLSACSSGQPSLHEHFDNLKTWIVPVYYSSEQGMRELGWTDDFYFESPAQCPHPDGHQQQ